MISNSYSRNAMSHSAALQEEELRGCVEAHFSTIGPVPPMVEFIGKVPCANSTLWEFAVILDGAPQSILVKTPRLDRADTSWNRSEASPVPPRFRLFEKLNPIFRAKSEFEALTLIYEHLPSDARFGVIRPLGFIAETGAILMEKRAVPSLKHLLAKRSRLNSYFTRAPLAVAFRNCGAWLREFHQLRPAPNMELRHERPDHFCRTVDRFSEYLTEAVGDRGFSRSIAAEITSIASDTLPRDLEIGVAHCDFAPRNILVGPAGQVTVLDTAARWRAPIYMDIGYFLISLKVTRAQIYSRGWVFDPTELAAYEEAFLSAYFDGQSVPWHIVRLYELQALLDRWAALAERLTQSASDTRLSRWTGGILQTRIVDGSFRRSVEHLLKELR